MYKSLLVALDGSKQSEKALILACHLARDDNAELHIVHAPEILQHPAVMTWGLGSVTLADHDELHVTGEPAHAIIHQAEKLGVEVIVMGCRGLGNLEGMAMGSVSHKVSHSAKCGVITVR